MYGIKYFSRFFIIIQCSLFIAFGKSSAKWINVLKVTWRRFQYWMVVSWSSVTRTGGDGFKHNAYLSRIRSPGAIRENVSRWEWEEVTCFVQNHLNPSTWKQEFTRWSTFTLNWDLNNTTRPSNLFLLILQNTKNWSLSTLIINDKIWSLHLCSLKTWIKRITISESAKFKSPI